MYAGICDSPTEKFLFATQYPTGQSGGPQLPTGEAEGAAAGVGPLRCDFTHDRGWVGRREQLGRGRVGLRVVLPEKTTSLAPTHPQQLKELGEGGSREQNDPEHGTRGPVPE